MYSDISYDEFDRVCHNLDGFYVGGEVVKVDTTDFSTVNFEKYIETARKFLGIMGESSSLSSPAVEINL